MSLRIDLPSRDDGVLLSTARLIASGYVSPQRLAPEEQARARQLAIQIRDGVAANQIAANRRRRQAHHPRMRGAP